MLKNTDATSKLFESKLRATQMTMVQ